MVKVPHRLYLSEDEMPKQWYNLRADMKELPDPMINPGTMKPAAVEDLYPVFCEELAKQEMDNTTRYIDIPEEIQEMYKIYRPSPLIRAYNLEKALGTPAKIYYKFEGNNTSGSHKLNSAIAQAYYAKKQGKTTWFSRGCPASSLHKNHLPRAFSHSRVSVFVTQDGVAGGITKECFSKARRWVSILALA